MYQPTNINEAAQKFHVNLRGKMDEYVHLVYAATKSFPRDELYGVTSQIRRSSLSVILNYIEGYARKRKLVMINFLETSYGSLQESKYLVEFSFREGLLSPEHHDKLMPLAEEIGAMLWKTLEHMGR